MPVTIVFTVKLVCSFLLSVFIFLLLRFRPLIDSWVQTRKGWIVTGLVVALRLIPFLVIFVILNESPRGDIPFFYWKAELAAQGKLVYRDFWSFHSPLFAYLLALPLFIWNNPKAIVALMGIGELLCIWITYRFYQDKSPDAFWKMILYVLLPGPLIICLFGGQEDIWLWGMGVGAVMVWQKKHNTFQVGLVLGLALLLLKVTFILIIFPLFSLFRNKVRFIGALLSVGIPTLIILYVKLGWLFLMPIQHAELPFSPNLTTVLRPFTGGLITQIPIQYLNWLGMTLTITLATWAGWRSRKKPLEKVFPSLWIITFSGLILFQPSAMAYYLFLYMIVLVFELTDLTNVRQVGILLLFNLLVISQPFVMVYNGQPLFNSFTQFRQPLFLLQYMLDVSFVGLAIHYLLRAWNRLEHLPTKSF